MSGLTASQSRLIFDKSRYNKGLPDLFCFNPNLGGVSNFTPLCWFSLNNSETVKAVTLQHSVTKLDNVKKN